MKKKIYFIDNQEQINFFPKKNNFYFYTLDCKIKEILIEKKFKIFNLDFYDTQKKNFININSLFRELFNFLNKFKSKNKKYLYLNTYQIQYFIFSVKTYLDLFYYIKNKNLEIICFRNNLNNITPYYTALDYLYKKKIIEYIKYDFSKKKFYYSISKILKKTYYKFLLVFIKTRFYFFRNKKKIINICVTNYLSKEIKNLSNLKKNSKLNLDLEIINNNELYDNLNKNLIFDFEKKKKQFSNIEKLFINKPNYIVASNYFFKLILFYMSQNYIKKKTSIKKKLKKYKYKLIMTPSNDNWISKLYSSIGRKLGIRTVSVQHGGGFGTHICQKNELNDFHVSDYFLSYSKKNYLRSNSILPNRSKIINIGYKYDNFFKEVKLKNTYQAKKKVLLIFDYPNISDYFYSFSKLKPNKIQFYDHQTKIIDILNDLKFNCVVRCFPGIDAGIRYYLVRKNLKNFNYENKTKLIDQINENDIIITDVLSDSFLPQLLSTFKKKVIIFNIKNYDFRNVNYKKDLAKACFYVKSYSQLKQILKFNIKNQSTDVRKKFLEKYAGYDDKVTYCKKINNALSEIVNEH